jgi:hypothetical protein
VAGRARSRLNVRLRRLRRRTSRGRHRARPSAFVIARTRSLRSRLRRLRRRASSSWRRTDPTAFTIGGLALAVTAVVLSLGLARGDGTGKVLRDALSGRRAPAPVAAPSAVPARDQVDPALPGINVHVNDEAGYLFSYPDDWELSSAGPVDELTDASGDVVMSFDLIPRGSLRHAMEHVVAVLRARYSDLQVVSDRLEPSEQGRPSSVLGATATDDGGGLIRLMVVTVRGPDQNRSITVRFSPGSDPRRALPDIQQIVGSFRTSVAV